MTNLIIAGGDRRTRSIELTHRLTITPGPRRLITIPCEPPATPPDDTTVIGVDDLDGALTLLDHTHGSGALAIESVDYWCLGPSASMPNPGNNPRIAAWNRRMVDAARKRARFRHEMQQFTEREPGISILLAATSMDNAVRLLGEYPMGVSAIGCERVDLDTGRTLQPGFAS